MNRTRQAVKTVNFFTYFELIIRQNETQYFTYCILCFILSDDDFENIVENLQFRLRVLYYLYFELQDVFNLRNLFVFVFSQIVGWPWFLETF